MYTVQKKKKKNLGWKQLNTLPLQFWSSKWWLRIKRKDSFYSILELWLFTNHMDICGCSFVFFLSCFFCSHIRRVGFASALLPYGHWVVLVWGRVVGVARSYDWTDGWLWILRLDQAKEWKDGLFFFFLFVFFWECRAERGSMSTPGLCTCLHLHPREHSHPALTNSPMHFCSFKLWGTILGMGAQLQQEDCYDFVRVAAMIFPNWTKRLEKHAFSLLLYITIFLYYLSK